MDEIARLLEHQVGVVSRQQVEQVERAGGRRSDIERAIRRREWVRLLPGVYLEHTGQPTWLQRAWAGALVAQAAALCGGAARRAVAGLGWRSYDESGPIEIAVEQDRHLPRHLGCRFRRMADLQSRVSWQAGPPRVRYEHALIDVASVVGADQSRIALLAEACQSRRTTAARLLDVASARSRIGHRRFIVTVLADIAEGTCSVLEHGYLTRVERPHGLPRGVRQASEHDAERACYRDVDYSPFGRIVELDGLLFHASTRQRDTDLGTSGQPCPAD